MPPKAAGDSAPLGAGDFTVAGTKAATPATSPTKAGDKNRPRTPNQFVLLPARSTSVDRTRPPSRPRSPTRHNQHSGWQSDVGDVKGTMAGASDAGRGGSHPRWMKQLLKRQRF